MLSEPRIQAQALQTVEVLILILLDHALRVLTMFRGAKLTVVLILILLDHALRELCH